MIPRLALLLALAGCGIKAPPRPPLDEPARGPALVDLPDAGCCQEKR